MKTAAVVFFLLLLLTFCASRTSSTRSLRDITRTRWSNAAATVAAAAAGLLTPLAAARAARIPVDQLATVFDEWDASLVSGSDPFARLDESDDALFYQTTRFVEHIDADAVAALTRFHRQRLTSLSARLRAAPDVLDLCSSWTSHLPTELYPTAPEAAAAAATRVVGLGMNMAELVANKQLTERVVQDLNRRPKLPFADASFDAVLLQLSIDYLTQPLQVLKDAGRVLKPNGELVVTFSNRLFFDKAVAAWTGKSDVEHVELVGNYLHFSGGGWKEPYLSFDLSPSPTKGDPLFAVVAVKAASS